MAIPFVMLGATGRMGQTIMSCAEALGLDCVAGFGRDIKENTEQDVNAKIAIDFSLPSATNDVIEFCKHNKLALVSGVTGYDITDFEKIKKMANELPVFWAPNMSIGIAVFKKMIAEFQAISDWDYHLHESHHKNKLDRPSGTAVYLANEAKRITEKEVEISDMRAGEVFGVHELFAMGPGEELSISHRAYSRDVFAKGALQVSKWLYQQPPGFYTMDDFLGA